jgi:hypothetical protein
MDDVCDLDPEILEGRLPFVITSLPRIVNASENVHHIWMERCIDDAEICIGSSVSRGCLPRR